MFKNVRKTYQFRCSTCHDPFASTRPGRSFCSVKCRAAHPSFRKVLMENLSKPKARSGPQRRGKTSPCPECATAVYAKPGKRQQKFCSRVCYRAWYAKRFDRNIGAIDSVKDLSGYDEFLSRPMLTCLHDGCVWTGHSLSHHMNTAHGITAEQLKERAGFNRGTGVISATLARILEARLRNGDPHPPTELALAAKGDTQPEVRREAIEHYTKASLAAIAGQST